MGVRTLIGESDGTTPAAAMYCSTSGWMIGPIWESEDAPDQIEAFLQWLHENLWFEDRAAIFGGDDEEIYHKHRVGFGAGNDPRAWTDYGLERLIAYWQLHHVGEDGLLLPAVEA